MAKTKNKTTSSAATLTPEEIITALETFTQELKTNLRSSPALPKQQTPAIYIDGSCIATQGGWAVVIYLNPDHTFEAGGYVADTTNNRMELLAAIEACKLLTQFDLQQGQAKVNIYTDSQYVQKGITIWLSNWKSNGWRSTSGPVKNRDLWEELDQLNLPIINWQWVRGHSGVLGNERADTIAQGFAMKKPVPLVNQLEVG